MLELEVTLKITLLTLLTLLPDSYFINEKVDILLNFF